MPGNLPIHTKTPSPAKRETRSRNSTARAISTALKACLTLDCADEEDESLVPILQAACESLGACAAGVLTPAHDGRGLVFHCECIGFTDEEQLRCATSENAGGWISTWLTGEPYLHNVPGHQNRPFSFVPNLHTHIAVPLLLAGRRAGILIAGSRGKPTRTWSEQDVRILALLGALVGQKLKQHALARQLFETHFQTTRALAMAVEAKDPYTHGHSDRVTAFAVKLSQKLGFTLDQVRKIRFGCILHDIGKLATPIQILQKPGQLTAKEYEIIKQHTVAGARIIEGLDFLEDARDIVLHHHERFDGKGYPVGLSGEEIPLGARICAVADAFDAMTSSRPYRGPMPPCDAQAELLSGSGAAHDPSLVTAFIEILQEENILASNLLPECGITPGRTSACVRGAYDT